LRTGSPTMSWSMSRWGNSWKHLYNVIGYCSLVVLYYCYSALIYHNLKNVCYFCYFIDRKSTRGCACTTNCCPFPPYSARGMSWKENLGFPGYLTRDIHSWNCWDKPKRKSNPHHFPRKPCALTFTFLCCWLCQFQPWRFLLTWYLNLHSTGPTIVSIRTLIVECIWGSFGMRPFSLLSLNSKTVSCKSFSNVCGISPERVLSDKSNFLSSPSRRNWLVFFPRVCYRKCSAISSFSDLQYYQEHRLIIDSLIDLRK